jgi:large subunit ribosomal protein L23
MKINQVLLEPVLTEKATNLAKNKIYLFYVDGRVNKYQIKEVVQVLYKVKVKEIRISRQSGKRKRVGRMRLEKKLPPRKIAYVQLKEGAIDIFPVS